MSVAAVDSSLKRSAEASPAGTSGGVSVVIVNWNSGTLLDDCLKSMPNDGDEWRTVKEIIVVDNGSTDGSAQRAAAGRTVRVIRNETNLGFAAACNTGASAAQGEFILFLNPDCRVMRGAIDASRRALMTDAGVGVVGVALLGDDGEVSRSCHRFPGLREFLFKVSGLSAVSTRFSDGSMRDWAHDEDRQVDHVMGAFYMVRAVEFRALGGFDERFFVYLEDLDLSLRYLALGKRCLYLASARTYHKGGGSSEKVKVERLFYATRSRVLYAFKHFSGPAAWGHLLATLLVEPLARVAGALMRGRTETAVHVVRAFGKLYRDLPLLLRSA